MTWPYIEYIKGTERVTLKLPDDLDAWEFMAWMDQHFLGITPAMPEARRREELELAKHMARVKRK